jgi:protein-L-isoaspartate(D-aspartate) O-methyltransferase
VADTLLDRQLARFVDDLVGRGAIASPRLAQAFRSVPRHLFLPGVSLDEVYRDSALALPAPGEALSSATAPSLMAFMLSAADPDEGDRVLEIGAGTGFNAALLAALVGPRGRVVSVEVADRLAVQARSNLAAAGVDQVSVVTEDGWRGHPAGAPYDAIVVTAAATSVAPAWIDQLRPGGRLVLPLWLGPDVEHVIRLVRHEEGSLEGRSVLPVDFVPLLTGLAPCPRNVALGDLRAIHAFRSPEDVERLRSLLQAPARTFESPGFPPLGWFTRCAVQDEGAIVLRSPDDTYVARGIFLPGSASLALLEERRSFLPPEPGRQGRRALLTRPELTMRGGSQAADRLRPHLESPRPVSMAAVEVRIPAVGRESAGELVVTRHGQAIGVSPVE